MVIFFIAIVLVHHDRMVYNRKTTFTTYGGLIRLVSESWTSRIHCAQSFACQISYLFSFYFFFPQAHELFFFCESDCFLALLFRLVPLSVYFQNMMRFFFRWAIVRKCCNDGVVSTKSCKRISTDRKAFAWTFSTVAYLPTLLGKPLPIRFTIVPNSATMPGLGVNSSSIDLPNAPCLLDPQVQRFPSLVIAAL